MGQWIKCLPVSMRAASQIYASTRKAELVIADAACKASDQEAETRGSTGKGAAAKIHDLHGQ